MSYAVRTLRCPCCVERYARVRGVDRSVRREGVAGRRAAVGRLEITVEARIGPQSCPQRRQRA